MRCVYIMTGVEPGLEEFRDAFASEDFCACVDGRTESGPEKCTEAATADANLCLRAAPRMGINVRAQIENWFVLSLSLSRGVSAFAPFASLFLLLISLAQMDTYILARGAQCVRKSKL